MATVDRLKREGKSLSIKGAIFALEGIESGLNFYYSKHPNVLIYVGNVLFLEAPKDPLKRSQIKVMQMHIAPTTDILLQNDSFTDYARDLRRETKASFQELAIMCKNNNPIVAGVESFYGISHLANRRIERMGFQTEDVSWKERWKYEALCKLYVWTHLGLNKSWRSMNTKIAIPRRASISRERLIELYAPRVS